MIDVMVFNTGNFIGVVEIPEPDKRELVSLFEKVQLNDKEIVDILYFRDVNYAIVITENMVEYIKGDN